MPKRAKSRSHPKAPSGPANGKGSASSVGKSPKSMVIRIGGSRVGSSVSQLVKDVRLMMEPDTAVRLKVRLAPSTRYCPVYLSDQSRNANRTG